MRRALVVASSLALFVVSTAARGDTADKLTRAAPWDGVTMNGAIAVAVASVNVETTDSPLELAIKGRVTSDLQRLATAVGGPWSQPPARDLLRTAMAAVANDKDGLTKAGGLASAVVRAALTYAVAEALPKAEGCTQEQRVAAVYEGFAMSAAFADFSFPERTGSALSSCVPIARAAQRLVDTTIVVQRLADVRLPENIDASAACGGGAVPETLSDDAKMALREAMDPKAAQTPEALAPSVAKLKGTLGEIRAGASKLGDVCLGALSARSAVDPDALAKLTELGLGTVDVQALARELKENVLACGAPATCASRDFFVATLKHLRTGLGKEDLLGAIRFAAAHLGIVPKEGSFEKDIFAALEASVVVDGDRVRLDQAETVKYLSARYGLDEKGAPRASTLIGLPTSLVLDLNAGLPAFADAVRLMGDATVGYRSARWGVVTNMGVNYFDLQSTGLLTDNLHAWGGVDGFYLTGGPESKLRIQGHLVAAVDYYDTTTIEANTTRAATFRFGDYDSLLLRALLEVGVSWRPTERWLLDGRIGGGGQHETYDSTSLDAKGVQFTSPETLSARGTASATVSWKFWPRHLGARVRGSGSMFQLTRETVSFSATSTGRTQAGLSSSSETQLYLQGRGYLDVDALKLFGIVPAAWFGSDFVSNPGASTIVPMAGIAFFRAN